MFLILVSFIAGVLTVLAPCILPILPIIIGGAAQDHSKRNPYIITGSLAVAVVVFTLALKFSTALIDVPQAFWNGLSGTIIVVFGLVSLFPGLWEKISFRFGLSSRSDALLGKSAATHNAWSDVFIGLSLGPVFSSCSPTYFVILATVLPRSLAEGVINLVAYALGLSLLLLLISLLGQRFVQRVRWAANPDGWFKRGLGILFIFVGVFIFTGMDKKVQTFLIEKGIYTTSVIEEGLLERSLKME